MSSVFERRPTQIKTVFRTDRAFSRKIYGRAECEAPETVNALTVSLEFPRRLTPLGLSTSAQDPKLPNETVRFRWVDGCVRE